MSSAPQASPEAASPADAKAAEKVEVKDYFETTGFERWNRIYSDSEEVNNVQRNIRIGHQKTVDEVLAWVGEQGDLAARSFCDAGCGVGSLTIPLALAATEPAPARARGIVRLQWWRRPVGGRRRRG